LKDVRWGASDLELALNRRANGDMEAQLNGLCFVCRSTVDGELGSPVRRVLARRRRSKGAQVGENRHGFEEIGLALAIATEDEIGPGRPLDPFWNEVSETGSSDVDQIHRAHPLVRTIEVLLRARFTASWA
jgi:hypothetical protein